MTIEDVMHTALHFKVRGNTRNLHPTTMPLWSLIQGLRENKALGDLTAQGRAVLEKDRDEFKAWKPRNLMSVYLAVRFRDREGRPDAENVSGYTGLAGFDFDHIEDPHATLGHLRTIPQVICAAVSASGHGVWCVAHVAAKTDSEYRACFARGVQTFLGAGMTSIDKGTHDPTRARFVASSPECWWRYDALGEIPAFDADGDVTVLKSGNAGKRAKIMLPANYGMSPELAFDQVSMVLASASEVEDGDRNNRTPRMCQRLKSLAEKAGVPPRPKPTPLCPCGMHRTQAIASTLLNFRDKFGK